MKSVPVAIVGTSWWADSMYLPALAGLPQAEVVAACGRDRKRAEALAAKWQISKVFTDFRQLYNSDLAQAVIVATTNESHYAISMAALAAGLHVLCEKPLALTYAQAAAMASMAQRQGVVTMVPFTYRYMPTARYIKELIDEGYIGRPYHLNMRYYTGYGRQPGYQWRFDAGRAGSAALGDIGSHFLYLAEWYFGPVVGVTCQLGQMVERPPLNPEGQPYERGDDTALLLLAFANGAQGVIHATTVAYENTPFGQTHHMEFHGSQGTLYHTIDWDRVQRVSGAREGEGDGLRQELPLPERLWAELRRDTVHHTYKDVFRRQETMARAFVLAIARGEFVKPDFADGARMQRLLEAALRSDREGQPVSLID